MFLFILECLITVRMLLLCCVFATVNELRMSTY